MRQDAFRTVIPRTSRHAIERAADVLIDALEDDLEARQLARELAAGTWSGAFASRLPFDPIR